MMEIPKWLEPTNKTEKILLGIFILVLIASMFKFPLGSMMAGNTNVQFEIGWPAPFLILDMESPERNPFFFLGLLADMLFYLVIAYWLDIIATVCWKEVKKIFKELIQEIEERRMRNKKTL